MCESFCLLDSGFVVRFFDVRITCGFCFWPSDRFNSEFVQRWLFASQLPLVFFAPSITIGYAYCILYCGQNGKTALDIAKFYKKANCVALLERAQRDPSSFKPVSPMNAPAAVVATASSTPSSSSSFSSSSSKANPAAATVTVRVDT